MQSVSSTLINYGFYGVNDNKLVTDESELKLLTKFFNQDLAKSVNKGKKLDCNPSNWTVIDWYDNYPCSEQRNTFRLEETLKEKGIKTDKFPVYFSSGNIASLLFPLILYPQFKDNDKFDFSADIEFKFNVENGLKFTAFRTFSSKEKARKSCAYNETKAQKLVKQQNRGIIIEHLFTSSNGDLKGKVEHGKTRMYLVNSLQFPDSEAILFYSKELSCFWDKEAPLDLKNTCEIKTVAPFFGIKQPRILIKNVALAGVRRVLWIKGTKNEVNEIEDIKDIETLDADGIIPAFYDCLNKFITLIIKNCRKNNLSSGEIVTYRAPFGRFLVVYQEEYFWAYEFDFETKLFSDGQKFPRKLTAIRWPMSDYHPRFNLQRIRNIQNYEFEAALNSNRSLHYVDGNCLLVVKKNSELTYNLAKKFKFKVSLEDPIFTLVEQLLLIDYYEKYEE